MLDEENLSQKSVIQICTSAAMLLKTLLDETMSLSWTSCVCVSLLLSKVNWDYALLHAGPPSMAVGGDQVIWWQRGMTSPPA